MSLDKGSLIFYCLFHEEWKALVRSIKFRCNMSWADAEDIAIDVGIRFLRFDFRKLERLGAEDQRKLIYGYLKHCINSTIVDFKRCQERDARLLKVLESDGRRIRISPERVRKAFQELPEEPKLLLTAIFYEEKTIEELQVMLSERLGHTINPRAIQARVQRALQKLETALTRD